MKATHEKALPSLIGWEPTRDTLHAYSKVLGAFSRALAKPRPHWWHISLKLEAGLLWTEELDPGKHRLRMSMDLSRHVIEIRDPANLIDTIGMGSGLTANELASHITESLARVGLKADPLREKYANNEPRTYDPQFAQLYGDALQKVYDVQSSIRSKLPGAPGPVQLWPHNFDQAFEWFSDQMIETSGASGPSPAQINFGFAPGDATHAQPYFYSNPWPFPDGLSRESLPAGAAWFDQGWTGSLFPYETLVDNPEWQRALESYYRRIFNLAFPSLRL